MCEITLSKVMETAHMCCGWNGGDFWESARSLKWYVKASKRLNVTGGENYQEGWIMRKVLKRVPHQIYPYFVGHETHWETGTK